MDHRNICQVVRYSLLVVLLVAQDSYSADSPLPIPHGFVEAGANHHSLTGNFDNWNGLYAKGIWQQYSDQIWNWEVLRQSEFNDRGTYFSGGLTHTIDEDWYLMAGVGISSAGFFLPKHRVDFTLNRKWLPERNLVTTVGTGYITARDAHRDRALLLGAAYYFETPWILEGGVRWNHSTPGSINTNRYFMAVTQGQDKVRYLTLRLETGREAYQLIDVSSLLVDFHSDVISFTWREWLQKGWGLNAVIERYSNPFYNRHGVIVGIFREF